MEKPTKDHIKPLSDGGALTRKMLCPAVEVVIPAKEDKEMLSWYKKPDFFETYRLKKIEDYLRFVASLEIEEECELVVT